MTTRFTMIMLMLAASPAAAQSLRFTPTLGLGTVYDTNLDRDAEGAAAVGFLISGDARLRMQAARADVQVEYGIGLHRYDARPDRDRTTHRGRIALTLPLSSYMTFATVAEGTLGGMSEDRELGTEFSIAPRIDVNFDERNRIRLRAMHRIRRFGERSGRDAVNQGVGLDYRVGSSDRPRMEMGSRYEVSRTPDPRSEFQRWTHRVVFTAPLGPRLELGLGASQITRTYPKRFVELESIGSLDLDDEERRLLDDYLPQSSGTLPLNELPDDLFLRWRDLPRRDEIWAPVANLTVRAAKGVTIRIGYELEVRLSTDLRKGYSGHTFEVRTGLSL